MDECLAYFRQAVRDPASVPPWSEWWAQNATLVEQTFPLIDYVRLKHRRLLGARQILQIRGELPEDFMPSLHFHLPTASCGECGERVTDHSAGPGGGYVTCPNCGVVCTYDTRPDIGRP